MVWATIMILIPLRITTTDRSDETNNRVHSDAQKTARDPRRSSPRFARERIPAVSRPTAIRPRETRAKNQAVKIDRPYGDGDLPPGLST